MSVSVGHPSYTSSSALFGTKAPERPRLREKRREIEEKRPSMEGETSTPTKQGYAVGIFWSWICEATKLFAVISAIRQNLQAPRQNQILSLHLLKMGIFVVAHSTIL